MAQNLKPFQKYIKQERKRHFPKADELVLRAMKNLGLDKKDEVYFCKNASAVVEKLREECWNEFLKIEREFTEDVLIHLAEDESGNNIKNMAGKEAVVYYVQSFSDEIYTLSLSNTQSRRSRAGSEFEAIIESVLRAAGISVESQADVGKDFYESHHMTKIVDLIIPSAQQFIENKHKCLFVTAKTTLRERWQEVPEEMSRTGIDLAYLATIDENISANNLDLLYEHNVVVTTTKNIKENCYAESNRVITFEDLIKKAKSL